MSAVHQAHPRVPSVRRTTAEHPGIARVARIGWLAKGVVYAIAGILAVSIGLRASGWSDSSTGDQEASPTGAIKTIAGTTGGPLLLWVLAVGMFLYAAWRLLSAALPSDHDASTWIHRVGYVASAGMYIALGVTAISLAGSTSTTEADGNAQVSSTSSGIMSHDGGRLLVGAIGLIVLAVGVFRIVKGAKVDMNDELDMTGMSSARRTWTQRLGAVGEVGRGVGFGMIGFFLLRSAVTYDANEATGLDGALRRLAMSGWGAAVVVLIGVGMLAYGTFCAATFHRRRLEPA
jgi:hypothetical protein